MPETLLRSQRVKIPTGQRLATRPEPSLAAVLVTGRLMRRQVVNGPVETSLENLDIVVAQAFIAAEGSSRAPAKVRVPAPPGCVTSARAQGTGGNLGGPRASRTEPWEASNMRIGRGGAREQATRVNPVSADTGLTANKSVVSSRTEEPDRVGASEGDWSLHRRDGGVGWANSTGEVGEAALAATRRRKGAKRMRRSQKRVSEWCRNHRYYGITGNMPSLKKVRNHVVRTWRKWLNRRSQRGRMPWHRFEKVLDRLPLPNPAIVHSAWKGAVYA